MRYRSLLVLLFLTTSCVEEPVGRYDNPCGRGVPGECPSAEAVDSGGRADRGEGDAEGSSGDGCGQSDAVCRQLCSRIDECTRSSPECLAVHGGDSPTGFLEGCLEHCLSAPLFAEQACELGCVGLVEVTRTIDAEWAALCEPLCDPPGLDSAPLSADAASGQFGPVARLSSFVLPETAEQAVEMGCSGVGLNAGYLLGSAMRAVMKVDTDELVRYEQGGVVKWPILLALPHWRAGDTGNDLHFRSPSLEWYRGREADGQWRVAPRASDGANGARLGQMTASTSCGVLEATSEELNLASFEWRNVEIPVVLEAATVHGALHPHRLGFDLRDAVLTGYLTRESLQRIVGAIVNACADEDAPESCRDSESFYYYVRDQEVDSTVDELLAPILGGYDARIVGGRASRCDIDQCNAISLCAAVNASSVRLDSDDIDVETAFTRMGGDAAFSELAQSLTRRMWNDYDVNTYYLNGPWPRGARGSRMENCLALQLATLAGKPGAFYPGASGGVVCRDLATVHAGLGISSADFAEFMKNLSFELYATGAEQGDIDLLMSRFRSLRMAIVEDVGNDANLYQRLRRQRQIRGQMRHFVEDVLLDDPELGPPLGLVREEAERLPGRSPMFNRLTQCLVRWVSAIDGPAEYGRETPGSWPSPDIQGSSCRPLHCEVGLQPRDCNRFSDLLLVDFREQGLDEQDLGLIAGALEDMCANAHEPCSDQ